MIISSKMGRAKGREIRRRHGHGFMVRGNGYRGYISAIGCIYTNFKYIREISEECSLISDYHPSIHSFVDFESFVGIHRPNRRSPMTYTHIHTVKDFTYTSLMRTPVHATLRFFVKGVTYQIRGSFNMASLPTTSRSASASWTAGAEGPSSWIPTCTLRE